MSEQELPSIEFRRKYRAKVRAEYDRIGPPEGRNYFEGWRAFLNREEAAGKHPKWFWDSFINTGEANPDGSWRIEAPEGD